MKKDIHPTYVDTLVTCTCGNSFHTRSTIASGEMRVDVPGPWPAAESGSCVRYS